MCIAGMKYISINKPDTRYRLSFEAANPICKPKLRKLVFTLETQITEVGLHLEKCKPKCKMEITNTRTARTQASYQWKQIHAENLRSPKMEENETMNDVLPQKDSQNWPKKNLQKSGHDEFSRNGSKDREKDREADSERIRA